MPKTTDIDNQALIRMYLLDNDEPTRRHRLSLAGLFR
jgi:hypothetical protein